MSSFALLFASVVGDVSVATGTAGVGAGAAAEVGSGEAVDVGAVDAEGSGGGREPTPGRVLTGEGIEAARSFAELEGRTDVGGRADIGAASPASFGGTKFGSDPRPGGGGGALAGRCDGGESGEAAASAGGRALGGSGSGGGTETGAGGGAPTEGGGSGAGGIATPRSVRFASTA